MTFSVAGLSLDAAALTAIVTFLASVVGSAVTVGVAVGKMSGRTSEALIEVKGAVTSLRVAVEEVGKNLTDHHGRLSYLEALESERAYARRSRRR